MKAANRTVLFTITGAGATTKRVPVAIFANEDACAPYAVAVLRAYREADLGKLKEIGLPHLITESGDLAVGLKFQRLTLPYAPAVASGDPDPFGD